MTELIGISWTSLWLGKALALDGESDLCGYFPTSGWFCQVDPLSLLYFIVVADAFSYPLYLFIYFASLKRKIHLKDWYIVAHSLESRKWVKDCSGI